MDMFKVFKTTGIEGNYTISNNPIFISNNCWSIFPAKHKTTKKQCSVWQFNKKDYQTRLTNNGIINNSNRKMILNDIYDNLKKFVSNQSKFKHPNFLTVIEPFEDHKNRILFVTEYIVNDLYSINKEDLDEIIITKGMLQVANGLKFLHDSVHNVHLNINPSSIVITENFDWKITGLSFIENLENGIVEKYVDPLDNRLPQFLNYDFRFTSPNLLLKHNADYIDDLFSISAIIYYLFSGGEFLIKCSPSSSLLEYERSLNRLNQILNGLSGLNNKHTFFEKIPDNYYPMLVELLKTTQESNKDVIDLNKNLTIDDFIDSNIFNNELIKVLNVIDEFSTLSVSDKLSFLKNLKNKIEKFPKVLLINKFIPILIGTIELNQSNKKNQLTTEEEEIISESCENLLLLSKQLSQLTFSDKVFPIFNKLLKELEFDNFKMLLIQNIVSFRKFLNASPTDSHSRSFEVFQKFLLELFEKCTNNNSTNALQELTLLHLKSILEFQQYTTITTIILPTITNIYSTTTSLKIKNLTIQSIILMMNNMSNKNLDDHIIIDKILPLIQNTSISNFQNQKFLINMINLYENLFLKLSKAPNKIISNGKEIEIFDLNMNIGFEIWKLSKFVKNKSDLASVWKIWDEIEKYLKNEVESSIDENQVNSVDESSQSMATSKLNSASAFTPVAATSTFASDPDITTMKTMTPRITEHKIQPLQLEKKKLAFGQTSTVNEPHTNRGIDWTNAESTRPALSFGVMKPKSAGLSSTPASASMSAPMTSNYNSVKLSNLNYSTIQPMNASKSYGVMQPTNNVVADDDDDGWGDFEVGQKNNGYSGISNQGVKIGSDFGVIKPTKQLNGNNNNKNNNINNNWGANSLI